LAAASPGPDFVLVSQQTLAKGRRTGLICSLGITLGLAVHIIYSVLGKYGFTKN
ncbi:LysE family transporter, partial [Burkholderia sp. SIMBA_062]|uniref:LysE family transporter n=1 Tax=Burkholderia sp. SIMBA_062 TaxID=3085803 RepID=UPI003979F10F